MKYMGSKARIAKEILPIILKDRKLNQWYIEPFVGGANIIDKVDGNKIGIDSNLYLIEMWKALQGDWNPPKTISKEKYNEIRDNKDRFDKHLVGYVGFNCSYSGKWFGGYAGKTNTKIGTIRDYQLEAFNNIQTQRAKLKNVLFYCDSYLNCTFPPNSILYLDPPYRGTTNYKDQFNHENFYTWCHAQKQLGHTLFISEYAMPNEFTCVWSKEIKSSLSSNGKVGGSKNSTEKLFILN